MSQFRWIVFGLLAAWMAGPVQFAAAVPLPVTAVTRNSDGVSFQMKPGIMKIQVCTDRIVHVVYAPGDRPPAAKSFVVTHPWSPCPFNVRENANVVTVLTGKLQVEVDRASGAVSFLNAAGETLCAEPAAGGKLLTPVVVNHENTFQVGQTFVSPKDEFLYGLGQFQEGLWNFRGIPLQLRQHNTQINLPVLVSSKGYGLLWDNASLTDFNPADQEVPIDPATHQGAYQTAAAGAYAFMVRGGNRKDEIGVAVDGQVLADIQNMWTPYAVSGQIALPAGHASTVRLLGGGPAAKVYARPLGDTTTFRSEVGDAIDYTFFYGPALDEVVAGYRIATGQAPLWPKWAFGFWQCRERYRNQQQILDAAAKFRQEKIPVDLIIQDWQYWGDHGWGAYAWDQTRYPDPAGMIQSLHGMNLKFMISAWCNPAGDAGRALADAHAVIPHTGWVDVFNPAGRAIRWQFMDRAFYRIGTDAWWQDATEPGDEGNAVEGATVALGSGNRIRNAYPLFASQGTYEGQRAAGSDQRVVNLTRSGYPGQQRYAAGCWSGDVHGDWPTFRKQIPAGLNFSLAGIPYWTTDTGGFFRPKDQYTNPDYNELLTRWFQWSTFCPILRIHGYQTETEMWKWPLAEKNLRAYDALRYRLLPYNYSVAWKVTGEGYTFMRALPMDFPGDPNVFGIGDQYMFGPAFLVNPVTQPGATSRRVYLPAGTAWHDFWTGEVRDGGRAVVADAPPERIPLFVRAGSIVPLGPALQYATETPADPIELRVYRGADAAFNLYEDEGDNYDYEHGERAVIPFTWDDGKKTLTIGRRQGSFAGMLAKRTFNIVWVGRGHGVGGEFAAGVDMTVSYEGLPVMIRAGD